MRSIKEILAGTLERQKDLAAAYLFGSQTTDSKHRDSDVDVALLFQRGRVPGTDQLLQLQDELTSALQKETDLVVLNDNSPIICMQVLQKGDKIVERDRRAVNEFFVRTMNEYDDLKRVRSVIEKKISRGRIYG